MPTPQDKTPHAAGVPSTFPSAIPTSKTRLSFNAQHSLIHSYFDDNNFKIQTPIRSFTAMHRRHLTASVDSEAGRNSNATPQSTASRKKPVLN
jgi:hypothetical protein